MDDHLKALIAGCKDKTEASRVCAAYLREDKGTETLTDRIFLARKRKEIGLDVSYTK